MELTDEQVLPDNGEQPAVVQQPGADEQGVLTESTEPVQPDIKGTEARNLRYDFSAVETHELSIALANKNQELISLENAKKSSTATYKAKMDIVSEEIGDYSNKVASGYEYRNQTCEVTYDKPSPGMKTLLRPDTNNIMTEQMTEGDYAYVAKQKQIQKQALQTELEF